MSLNFHQNNYQEKSPQLGSDRLQKLLAKNRAKQAQREAIEEKKSSLPPLKPHSASKFMAPRPLPRRPLLHQRVQNALPVKTTLPLKEKILSFSPKLEKLKLLLRRKKEDTHKVSPPPPLKKRTLQNSARSQVQKPESKFVKFLVGLIVKLGWVFSFALLVQLVFSERGVLDYYDKKVLWEEKVFEGQLLIQENEKIKDEIELIFNNAQYQKKLVRDHLGFIAEDEFLVLFPEGKKNSI